MRLFEERVFARFHDLGEVGGAEHGGRRLDNQIDVLFEEFSASVPARKRLYRVGIENLLRFFGEFLVAEVFDFFLCAGDFVGERSA